MLKTLMRTLKLPDIFIIIIIIIFFFCFCFFFFVLFKKTSLKNQSVNTEIIINLIIIIHFIENQPVNIKIIISIKIFCSINCKNSSTSLFTYTKSKIMVIVTISIRK